MIPPTIHKLSPMVCVSAVQKAIRRSLEAEAMQFAVEMIHTSKAFVTMLCNRLIVISHEDIDTSAAPWVVPFVQTAVTQAQNAYDPEAPGKTRMYLGNAIRLMCRSPKSREGDHFQARFGLANLLEDAVPEIPEWAFDKHTREGKRMGRGLDHFRESAALLINPDGSTVPEDVHAEEAYRLWKLKAETDSKRPSGKAPAASRPARPRATAAESLGSLFPDDEPDED